MTDRHRELVLKLAGLRTMVDTATLTPWRWLESSDTWSLHGEARDVTLKHKGTEYTPGMQIAKAAKHGTPYAEYWPNYVDSFIIVEAVNRLPFWLDWADDVAARHYPTICGCTETHFLCAPHRAYAWESCPEVVALIRAVDKLHG